MTFEGGQFNLTKRQREIYDFLRDSIHKRGYGPTVREIGQHFDIRSPNGVMCHLRALERKGLIRRGQNMSRAISLAEGVQQRTTVRYLGTAGATGPIQPAVSTEEIISFQEILSGRSIGCVRVESNNFTTINIANGDFLLIDSELALENGQHVAALDDRHALVICVVEEGAGQLVPLIPGDYTPMTRQVLGVITGVIRVLRR
ncbi:MAG: LexA repressor [Planctomycetota bacterium]|jgi:repressor LexA